MMQIKTTTFAVEKTDISAVTVSESQDEILLLEGQVLLAVEAFSFTANNITYATLGDTLRYWNFFPTQVGKGIIPVWGFAVIVASRHENVQTGHRFYGYYPMASHLIVEPSSVSQYGFTDATWHRKALPKIYNQYTNVSADPLYRQESEALQMLMRPLFTTSFLLEDFFRENNYFSANQLILTSASSKTAIGTALLLKENKSMSKSGYHVVGLTSARNRKTVESLGIYDRVVTYDQLAELGLNCPSAVIDFAGNGELLNQLQETLASSLLYISLVGVSHWDKRKGLDPEAKGVKPELFFAPSQAEKRLAEWSGAGFQQRLTKAWGQLENFSKSWLDIEVHNGVDNCKRVYQAVLSGKVEAQKGFILSLKGGK